METVEPHTLRVMLERAVRQAGEDAEMIAALRARVAELEAEVESLRRPAKHECPEPCPDHGAGNIGETSEWCVYCQRYLIATGHGDLVSDEAKAAIAEWDAHQRAREDGGSDG